MYAPDRKNDAPNRAALRSPTLKRVVDVALAAAALEVFAAPMLVIGAALWASQGKFPIFKQRRPGLGGRVFTMYKFRSMSEARDAAGELLPDAERLTPLGRFLRSTSLDELPEFFNVLKGDMSVVGPRPLLIEYLPLYSEHHARRHEVKPGITGWAQVNGRNALAWDDKLDLDVWYVDNWSLWLDAKILVRTVSTVLRRDGISQPNEATAAPFAGSKASS